MGPKMRMTQVHAIQDLSPHMRRIVLTGESLTDFPAGLEGAHVKAIFPDPKSGQKKPKLGMYLGFKKWMRSYTIRAFNPNTLKLSIDFAVNDHQGLASNWALNAKVGDYLGIAGPGDTKHTDMNAPQHLFFGDLTSLPAIAATLEKLPTNAVGQAWLQVPDDLDKQGIDHPKGITVNWIITKDKSATHHVQALASQPTDLSQCAIFIAAETQVVRVLKDHLNTHCQYNKSKLYASAYWNQKR